MSTKNSTPPLTDTIIVAISRLVDDAQVETREPSHSDIEFEIKRTNLQNGDPKAQGQLVGKAKRVRSTLSWALENAPDNGARFVVNLISHVKACGGFRDGSSNFVGKEAIQNAISAFKTVGFELTFDGDIFPLLLDNLEGAELTAALEGYVRRAKRGAEDAALVTGTGKDLLEATAAHILVEKWGSYPSSANFPGLLGQAFVALGFATPQNTPQSGEPTIKKVERALYESGCAVNGLRNKEGTGHGRPWIPSVTIVQAKLAVQQMGIIAEYMLAALKSGQ
ncbi:MAG: abortive infection family protein [Anaerolineae bacterium]|nr:abortive infection family protein [Anaerolineae bacterium]